MLTLDNLLTASRAKSSDEDKLRHAISCSPFLTRLCTKHAGLVQDLLENHKLAYQLADMQKFLAEQTIFDEGSLKKALRALRQAVMARIIVRDLNGLADVAEVMQTTTHLAECTINSALAFLHPALVAVHGQPVDAHGQPQHLVVIGMGKLGGCELNVSSDIDLIFAYASDGETSGSSPISHQQFFTRIAKQLIAAIDDITEDGFVFRVDMRLRPFGSEGALVSNLESICLVTSPSGAGAWPMVASSVRRPSISETRLTTFKRRSRSATLCLARASAEPSKWYWLLAFEASMAAYRASISSILASRAFFWVAMAVRCSRADSTTF